MTPPLRRLAAQYRQVAEHEATLVKLGRILRGLRSMRPSPSLAELIRVNIETTSTVERCLFLARDRLDHERSVVRMAVEAALRRHSRSIW